MKFNKYNIAILLIFLWALGIFAIYSTSIIHVVMAFAILTILFLIVEKSSNINPNKIPIKSKEKQHENYYNETQKSAMINMYIPSES